VHAGTQIAGVPLGHARDQIGGSSQRQRGRVARYGRRNLARQSERRQGIVDGAFVEASPRDVNVPCGGIARGSDLAFGKRVPGSDDANEAVAKQRLRPHLGTGRLAHDAGFQVDSAIAQRRTILVDLGQEAKSNAGSFGEDAGQELGAEVFDEALAGSQRERAVEFRRAQLIGGTQRGFRVVDELTDAIAQLERSR